LGFGLPKQTRKVQAQSDIDARRLKASASLYSGKAFQAIKTADAAIRNELLTMAIRIPSCFSGAYVLPSAMADTVRRVLEKRVTDRQELVDTFLRNEYENERDAARIALNGSFRESDFPGTDVLRTQFNMKWSLFNMDVPDNLPDDIKDAERVKFEENMTSVFQECRDALRNTLSELVGHLAEKLQTKTDGKNHRLHATTVSNLTDFLDTINSRDITSDDAIRVLSDKARKIIGTTSADDMKKDGTIRADIRANLDAVKGEIDQLIIRDGSRKIDLDME